MAKSKMRGGLTLNRANKSVKGSLITGAAISQQREGHRSLRVDKKSLFLRIRRERTKTRLVR
jgi:hypothetical protein